MFTEHIDVNITPNKRQLILHQEKALLLVQVGAGVVDHMPLPKSGSICSLSNDFLVQRVRKYVTLHVHHCHVINAQKLSNVALTN